MERIVSFFGFLTVILLAWLVSEDRKKFPWRVLAGGLVLQFLFAIFVLKTSLGKEVFNWARLAISAVISLSDEGAKFVFGGEFKEHFFAFSVLPTIIFVSALSSLFFYLGIMQVIVEMMARVMARVMKVSGAESLCAAANVFMGQTEAPMLIKPYLNTMTRSEILTMMCSGMATVAGGVMAAYIAFGIPAEHLLAASMMAAPASIVFAKIMIPEKQKSQTMGHVKVQVKSEASNAIDAACIGASDGMKLAINVSAMLIAFIALVALVNLLLGHLGSWIGVDLKLQHLFGLCFQPVAWIIGVPWSETHLVGQLIGEKVIINEFFAYVHMGDMVKAGQLSQRSINIATYALCGFANISSIAIQIGGIGAMAPDRRKDFAQVGVRALIGGNLASFSTASIAGILM